MDAGEPNLIRELLERHGTDYEAGEAAHLLRREIFAQGSAAVEPLVAALEDESGPIRALSMILLADIGDRRAVPPLIAFLQDEQRYRPQPPELGMHPRTRTSSTTRTRALRGGHRGPVRVPARKVATGSQQPPERSSPSTSGSGAASGFQRSTVRSAQAPGVRQPVSA